MRSGHILPCQGVEAGVEAIGTMSGVRRSMMGSAQQPEQAPAAAAGGARRGVADATADPGALPRLIKRYANRKLYDTVQGGFTSLARIRTMVREGIEVVVLDHSTGADRTVETLSRTLSRRRNADDPGDYEEPDVVLLAKLIRSPGRLTEAFNPEDYDAKDIQGLRAEVQALADTLDDMIRASSEAAAQQEADAARPARES
jgi:polyhydroxyalkanoate synthesis regulator protein